MMSRGTIFYDLKLNWLSARGCLDHIPKGFSSRCVLGDGGTSYSVLSWKCVTRFWTRKSEYDTQNLAKFVARLTWKARNLSHLSSFPSFFSPLTCPTGGVGDVYEFFTSLTFQHLHAFEQAVKAAENSTTQTYPKSQGSERATLS